MRMFCCCRYAAKLQEAAAEGIVEEGDWECSVCSSLNHRHRRTCRLCDLPCSTLRNRRVTRQDVEGLYGKELPNRQQAALEQRSRAVAAAEAARGHEREIGQVAGRVAARPPQPELLGEGREDSGDSLRREEGKDAAVSLSESHRVLAAPPEATSWSENMASSANDDAEEDYSVRRLKAAVSGGSRGPERALRRGGRGMPSQRGAAGAAAEEEEDLSEGEDEDEDGDETHLGATDVNRPESRHHYDDFYASLRPSRPVPSRGGGSSQTAPSRVGRSAGLKPKRQQKASVTH